MSVQRRVCRRSADELAHRLHAVLRQIRRDSVVDLLAHQRIVEQRGADADGRGAGDEKLQRVIHRRDAALADDRHVVPPRDFVHLVHFEQRDRLDRRPRQAALHVADHGPPRVHVDRHARDRVDHCERVRTGLDAVTRVVADVGLVRRELDDQRLLRRRAARRGHAARHLRIVAELHAAFLDVRAGDVHFDRIDRRIVEAPRDLDVVLDRRAADVGDEARLREIERRQDARHDVLDARILQADRVEHAHRRFVHAVRRVTEPRLARRAFEHDGAGVAIREALDARVLFAEADAARQQHDGRIELEAAEIDR